MYLEREVGVAYYYTIRILLLKTLAGIIINVIKCHWSIDSTPFPRFLRKGSCIYITVIETKIDKGKQREIQLTVFPFIYLANVSCTIFGCSGS